MPIEIIINSTNFSVDISSVYANLNLDILVPPESVHRVMEVLQNGGPVFLASYDDLKDTETSKRKPKPKEEPEASPEKMRRGELISDS